MSDAAATRETLLRLASLIAGRNRVEQQIAEVVGRPGERGHVGEFIAALIFDIELHESAAAKASDGVFGSGPLVGKSVNIKWYGRQEGILDVSPDPGPDLYLVLTLPPCTRRILAARRAPVGDRPRLPLRAASAPRRIGRAWCPDRRGDERAERGLGSRRDLPVARNTLLPLTLERAALLGAFASKQAFATEREEG